MGGAEIKVEKIGEYEFHVEMIPPAKGFHLAMKLTQVIGTIAGGDMSKALSSLSSDDIAEMTTIFAAYSKVKTPAGNLVPVKDMQDVLFAGKYGLMFKWLLLCTEANFGSFLGDLQGLANDLGTRLNRMFGKANSPNM